MLGRRPDTLPFFKPIPNRLGLYYHGKVESGTATLPGGLTIAHPQPSSGDAYLVQHPAATAPMLTAEELAALTAAGRQILDYAYLSGGNRDIGGQSLGAQRWLYCDSANTWIVRWAIEDSKLCIYLDGVFGRFGVGVDANDYVMTPRKLLTYEFTEDNQAVFDSDWYLHHSMSKTGAKSCFNLMVRYNSPYEYFTALHTTRQLHNYYSQCLTVLEVLTVTVSGNGSLTKGSIGDGISASTTTLVTDTSDTYSSSGETVSDDPITGCSCPLVPFGCGGPSYPEAGCSNPAPINRVRDLWYSQDGTLLWFMDSGGSLQTITYSLRTDRAATQDIEGDCAWVPYPSDPDCNPPLGLYGGSCEGTITCATSTADSVTYTLTIAGSSAAWGPSLESSTSEFTITTSGCTDHTNCDDASSLSQSGFYYDSAVGDHIPSPILHGSQNVLVALTAAGDAKAFSLEDGASHTAGYVATEYFAYDMKKSQWHHSTNLVGVV
jgi:hypothetical protein